jgi:hypothetical protein
MSQYKTLAARLASCVEARAICLASNNTEWYARYEEYARLLTKEFLPHGSGIDGDNIFDIGASRPDKLVVHTAFHHMDEFGVYDGWTQHRVIVITPTFSGVDIAIHGLNRNDIKDHLHEVFHYALNREVSDEAYAQLRGAS